MKLTAEQRDLVRCLRDRHYQERRDLDVHLHDDADYFATPSQKFHRAYHADERRRRHAKERHER